MPDEVTVVELGEDGGLEGGHIRVTGDEPVEFTDDDEDELKEGDTVRVTGDEPVEFEPAQDE